MKLGKIAVEISARFAPVSRLGPRIGKQSQKLREPGLALESKHHRLDVSRDVVMAQTHVPKELDRRSTPQSRALLVWKPSLIEFQGLVKIHPRPVDRLQNTQIPFHQREFLIEMRIVLARKNGRWNPDNGVWERIDTLRVGNSKRGFDLFLAHIANDDMIMDELVA